MSIPPCRDFSRLPLSITVGHSTRLETVFYWTAPHRGDRSVSIACCTVAITRYLLLAHHDALPIASLNHEVLRRLSRLRVGRYGNTVQANIEPRSSLASASPQAFAGYSGLR